MSETQSHVEEEPADQPAQPGQEAQQPDLQAVPEQAAAPEVAEKPLAMEAAGVYTFLHDVVKDREERGLMPVLTVAELAQYNGLSKDPLTGYCAGILGAVRDMAAKKTVAGGKNGENAESLQQLIDDVETGGFVFDRLAKDSPQGFVEAVALVNPQLFNGIGETLSKQDFDKVVQWVKAQFKASLDALNGVKSQLEIKAVATEAELGGGTKDSKNEENPSQSLAVAA